MTNSYGHQIGIDRSQLKLTVYEPEEVSTIKPWVVSQIDNINFLYESVRVYGSPEEQKRLLGTLFDIHVDQPIVKPEEAETPFVSMIFPIDTSTMMVRILHQVISNAEADPQSKQNAGILLGSMPASFRDSSHPLISGS